MEKLPINHKKIEMNFVDFTNLPQDEVCNALNEVVRTYAIFFVSKTCMLKP